MDSIDKGVIIFSGLLTIFSCYRYFRYVYRESRISFSRGKKTGLILVLSERDPPDNYFQGTLQLEVDPRSYQEESEGSNGYWHFCLAGPRAEEIALTMGEAMRSGKRCILSYEPFEKEKLERPPVYMVTGCETVAE